MVANSLGVFFLCVSQIWFDLKGWYRYWASPLAGDLLGYREWERRAGEAETRALAEVRWLFKALFSVRRWRICCCCWRGSKKFALPFSTEKLCVGGCGWSSSSPHYTGLKGKWWVMRQAAPGSKSFKRNQIQKYLTVHENVNKLKKYYGAK